MCDYSLMALPNRLAITGEELITHRFRTGAIGFISVCDKGKRRAPKALDLIERIVSWLNGPRFQYTAVCLPPGARLAVLSVPPRLNAVFSAIDPQEVTFTQISPGPGFRDAIEKRDGQQILLQNLQDGFRVRVVSLSIEANNVPQMQAALLC